MESYHAGESGSREVGEQTEVKEKYTKVGNGEKNEGLKVQRRKENELHSFIKLYVFYTHIYLLINP